MPGRRTQRRVGGKEDALGARDLGPLAELAERDHVVLAAAERAPVAPCVLDQLVGLRQPERAPAAAQPVVEHDGGDLAALAGAGAVAEHPAAPEAHRGGQHLAVVGDIGGAGTAAIVAVVLRAALHGLPARTDAVVRGEMAGVGLARKDDAFELGVRQEPVRHHAFGQHRPVGRHGMRHRGHGGGLHQRRGMGDGARHPRDARPPRFVGAGIGLRGRFVRNGVGGAGLDDELGDRSPFVGGRRRGSGIGAGAAFVAGGLTALPNRSRAGPVGMDRAVSGVIGSLGGTLAMTALSSSPASAARASRSMSISGLALRSSTVSRVSKPVPRRA